MTTLPLKGGCQCGALRYEVCTAPFMVYNCHCTNCQKISGSAFNISVTIAEAGLVFVAGQPAKVEWLSDAGSQRFGWFCGRCGSRIAHGQTPSSNVLSLRAGTLDDTSWIEPVGDIWVRSKQPWLQIPESRLKTDRQPADYAPFIAAFRAQGRFWLSRFVVALAPGAVDLLDVGGLLYLVALFLALGAAEHHPLGGGFSLTFLTRLALAMGVEIDDVGHIALCG